MPFRFSIGGRYPGTNRVQAGCQIGVLCACQIAVGLGLVLPAIRRFLQLSESRMDDGQQVFVVDGDADVRDTMRGMLEADGFEAHSFSSAGQFLAGSDTRHGCLIADIRMSDMSGLELQDEIVRRQMAIAVIIMTGYGDVPQTVRAMKAGAIDFLEKPLNRETLLASVRRALIAGAEARRWNAQTRSARNLLASLTPRERGVLDMLVAGCSNKVAAHELGISPRTVEVHRAHIMDKMKASSIADLVRTALTGGQ